MPNRTELIELAKKSLPAEFRPIIDGAIAAFKTMTATEILAWITLATADPDAAILDLQNRMAAAQLAMEHDAAGAELDAAVAENVEHLAAQRELLKKTIVTIIGLAATFLTGL